LDQGGVRSRATLLSRSVEPQPSIFAFVTLFGREVLPGVRGVGGWDFGKGE